MHALKTGSTRICGGQVKFSLEPFVQSTLIRDEFLTFLICWTEEEGSYFEICGRNLEITAVEAFPGLG